VQDDQDQKHFPINIYKFWKITTLMSFPADAREPNMS